MYIERSYVPNIPPKGKYRKFRVDDDEMDTGETYSLSEGDFVLARRIDEKYWTQRLNIERWVFVLVFKTGDYIMRKILEHDVDKMSVLCHPLNPIYNDSIVYLGDLLELYNVIKIIEKNTGM